MNYRATTMTPNTLYQELKFLSEKELKILLVVIRQTAGWIDPITKKRKERDFISHRFFISATGLTSKSVSNGLSLLLDKEFIAIETHAGKRIYSEKERRGRFRKFYRCLLFEKEKSVKSTAPTQSILRSTKLTPTKLKKTPLQKVKQQTQKLTDLERYHQIIGRSVN